ncbi:hypothetical protein KTD19_22710 [Burkholderia multivorans]|uniref:Uncharacterized protein n=3 Tax=Burkholderia cepacia complex TaxID=87882 RepID=A0A0H3KQT1_BURM1|nr:MULTISPECIES: hypothetical protein [Burkholderia cepacia complex]ABX19569.1 conserved hypothetical protein [Burkholderia multivorans ATCC 17616]AIO71585.1 hypothetical protein DM80_6356 [Burkholderia multivorans]AOK69424.1 hypothetical protein WM33_27745 [Burkholderia multivorans]AYY99604.1 hypothetical protein EGY19_19525 [Burkholderia multivorans]KVV23049.1 hypothetical protein WK80_21235 [Burkholderia multivorans]
MSHADYRSDSGMRAATSATSATSETSGTAALDMPALVALARDAGMLVILDGQIGRERYESVTGSIATLARFAQALQLSALKVL